VIPDLVIASLGQQETALSRAELGSGKFSWTPGITSTQTLEHPPFTVSNSDPDVGKPEGLLSFPQGQTIPF
jgi:hypothetical protein